MGRWLRRATMLHATLFCAWAMCTVSSMAAADLDARPVEDLGLHLGRFGVLYALLFTLAHRFRDLAQVVYDAFVSSHAHLFVKGLLVLLVLYVAVVLCLLRSTQWALMIAPAFIFAQAILALFVAAGPGFDRLAFLGLWMLFVHGASGSPRDFGYGAAFLAAAVPGYAVSHFHAILKRHDAEDRQPVVSGLAIGAVFAALVLIVYTGLYQGMPRLYGITHDYIDPTVRRIEGSPVVPTNESGAVDRGDGGWVRLALNGATLLGGVALVVLLLRGLRRRGPADATEEEERTEGSVTVVEDLPQPAAVKRRKTWLKTPRALVIMYYNSLTDRLKPFGVQRLPHQTPAEFADAVVAARPETAQPVDRLTRTFRRAKYSLDAVTKQDVDDTAAWVTAIAGVFERTNR